MKKLICLVMASVFYILGIIGIILPIIPQIPFFIIGSIFMIIGFEKIKDKILKSDFYREHLKGLVNKNKTLKKLFSKKRENNNK